MEVLTVSSLISVITFMIGYYIGLDTSFERHEIVKKKRKFKLGLGGDIKGGVHIIRPPTIEKIIKKNTDRALNLPEIVKRKEDL